MTAVFILASVFIVYTYLVYPLCLLLLARKRMVIPPEPARWPSVSLLIPARNEEKAIGAKIENALRLDYPGPFEIVVASDGSQDATAAVVGSYSSPLLRFFAYPDHWGKMGTIARAVPELRGEIIVFTDATALFAPDALRLLVRPFADPEVGAASGELILREEREGGAGVRVDWYWKLEKFMRRREAALFSCLGATGAIWALRRDLFRALPRDTILDDFLLPLEAVRRGRRIVFVEEAKAFETEEADWRREFRRKVRTLAGNYQAFARAPWLLNPLRSPLAPAMISHKLFRLFIPCALLLAFISSALSSGGLRPLFWLQAIFYLFASLGWLSALLLRRPARIFSPPFTFCLLNAAAGWAFIVYFFRRKSLRWD